MKNITLVVVCIVIVLFASCKKHNSENLSKEMSTHNKSDSLQTTQTLVDERSLEKFVGLSLSYEMIEKIKTHTTDQKIVRVIKNSRGLENLMGHPVIGTVTVINPNGKVLKNFPNDLHYTGDVVVEDNFKHIFVFRNSFVSHKGDCLKTSNIVLIDESELEQTNKHNYKTSSSMNLSIPDQITQYIQPIQPITNLNGVDSLSLTEKDLFSSERLERYKIIQNDINETMSRILILQAKLENPIVFNDPNFNVQFKDELRFQYDLLNEQQELIKEIEETLLE